LFIRTEAVFVFIFAVLVAVLMILLMYDVIRRKGNGIYEEISHALQGLSFGPPNIPTEKSLKSEINEMVKELEIQKTEVRFVLKDFNNAADLPIIPGKTGAAFYFALNVVISSTAFWNLSRLT